MKPSSNLRSTLSDFSELNENEQLAGYSALIENFSLSVPAPDFLCAIGTQHAQSKRGRWRLFSPRHKPEDTLKGNLTFALKYEGVDLVVLSSLFKNLEPAEIEKIVQQEPTGSYSRRIWFLFEWLTEKALRIDDCKIGNFVNALNEDLQFGSKPKNSSRHRVRNNLPGTKEFCPTIKKTEKIEALLNLDLSKNAKDQIGKTHPDLLSRAAAFLILKDSKASYKIEGEDPSHNRVERWAKATKEAGIRPLTLSELEHLQTEVIGDSRFTELGLRKDNGFIGEHDRVSSLPLPDHISAKPEDLNSLLNGMLETHKLLNESELDPVLVASVIAFGFVFIHPFEDGNGRIHRYLFHHILAERGFVPKGLIFPVSAVILEKIEEYRKALEHYSKPRLQFVDWRPTPEGNVEVLNETRDLFRYFDATRVTEFLFECVNETVVETLPQEVDYLTKYDQMNDFIKNYVEMPRPKGRQFDSLFKSQ